MTKVLLKALLMIALASLITACAVAANRPLQLASGEGPAYPAQALEQGVQGYVVVGYDVDTNGAVTNLSVIEAQPAGVFDAAALEAVAKWRFNPVMRRGVVEPAPGRISRVEFRLGDTQSYVR